MQERLGKVLAHQPPARSSQRAANGKLTLSNRRLGQQQIRHVRACHQQQKPRGAEQKQQRRASLVRDRVLQRDDNSIFEQIIALLARGIVNAPGYRADVEIRLLHSRTVAEAPNHRVVMRSPAWVFAVQIGWEPQIHVSRETKSRGEHADNGEEPAIKRQVRRRADPGRPKILPPISIANENGRAGSFFRVAGAKIPSENRLNSQNLQETRRERRHSRTRRLTYTL